MSGMQKPIIGFTCGDLNGIGIELIIKTLGDNRILDQCTPVIFASNKSINFYRKTLPEINFTYHTLKDFTKINPKVINMVHCWEEEVAINPGVLNEIGGNYGKKSLITAVEALKAGNLDGLVTAPLHKKNIQSTDFDYTGHTPFLKDFFVSADVLMFMVAENMRVGLLTEHVPVSDIPKHVQQGKILSKLKIMEESLKRDFGIEKPVIAVLGLNPHMGDEGLIGNEEETVIKPAIQEAKGKRMMVFGPYSADAFFARGMYAKFDAVLAMYHDQGLIPFKSLTTDGVNYTAGISTVRTSPDHGTAFDIAGKGIADHSAFLNAAFTCIDIVWQRRYYDENRINPLQKRSHIIRRGEDEIIVE